jgi:hypothetical protein
MIEEPRITVRYLTKQNGKRVLQTYVGAKMLQNSTGLSWTSAEGWVDVPEFIEKVEEV